MRNGIGKKMILFADEAGFSAHPKLGRVWTRKGTQPRVLTASTHNKRVNVFGWVDPVSGKHGIMQAIQGNTEGFIRFLSYILYRIRGVIELWVDQAKWHKGPTVESFCMRYRRRLRICYMPKYHPELNFQERLWKAMRYEETTNAYFESKFYLRCAIFKRSQRWKPDKIAHLCHLI